MERLTVLTATITEDNGREEKVYGTSVNLIDKYIDEENQNIMNMLIKSELCNKLGPLEDIENELGIDLITLFKALKNGIYHITSNKNMIGYLDVKWSWCIGRCYFKTKYGSYYFKDYGKTWALTKEELQ